MLPNSFQSTKIKFNR